LPRGSPPNGLSSYKTWVPSAANDYFVVLGRGSITIADTIVMTGNMNILGTLSGSVFSYTLQEDATLAIKLSGNTVFSFAVAGAVRLGNDGIAAALVVTLNSGIPSNLGFTMNASFVLELNTTGQPQPFFVPNVGAINIPANQIILVHGDGHLYGETRPQGGHGDVRADAANVQLFGQVLAKANHSGVMSREILTLRGESAIRADEEKLLGDQRVERGDVGRQLRVPEPALELHDLRIRRSDED